MTTQYHYLLSYIQFQCMSPYSFLRVVLYPSTFTFLLLQLMCVSAAGSKEKESKHEHKSPQPSHHDEKQGSSNSKHNPSPRKTPNDKTPPTNKPGGSEAGENPPDFTTCMFCGASDNKWNEDALDLHYWKVISHLFPHFSSFTLTSRSVPH